MIHINSCDTFLQLVNEFEKDNISFKLIGHSYEDYTGMYSGPERPPNNKWFVKILILTSLGQFYYSEIIYLEDTEKVNNVKAELSALKISNYPVNSRNGIIRIG